MSAVGIELKDGTGRVVFSTRQTTWSPLAVFVVAANDTVTQTVPALALMTETVAYISFVTQPAIDQESYQHRATVNTAARVVTVSGGNRDCRVILLGR